MTDQFSKIFIYIKGALKYKWIAVGLAWVICLLGWSSVMFLPNKYTSVATVHIDSTTLLQPLLKDIAIQQDATMLVRVMKQLMFTVPNLNKIIQLSNLDFLVTNDLQRFELYENMKEDILIVGGKRDGLFEVSYEANEPNMAKKVVNAVLKVFSEQTQLSTMEDVNSSQRFIEEQISEYEVRLRNAEKAREDFKRANFGLLPEEGQGQITKLHATYGELENAKLLLSEAVSKRNIIRKQMQEVIDAGDAWSSNDSMLELSPEDQKIQDLDLRKMDLLLKYTADHPTVRAINVTLEEALKRKKQAERDRAVSGLPNAGALSNPYVQQLKITLNSAEANVASNGVRVNFLKKRIENYKQQLDSRLTVETEMQNLNRDYTTINGNYQKLVQRREQARMSEKIDTETVAIKFKIADPPNTPLSPSGPKRLLLLSGVLIMALAVGFGLAYLLYYLKPTYMTTKQLREETGLPVLGTVSMQVLESSNEKKKFVIFLSVMLGLIIVYFGLMSFEYLRLHGINPFNPNA